MTRHDAHPPERGTALAGRATGVAALRAAEARRSPRWRPRTFLCRARPFRLIFERGSGCGAEPRCRSVSVRVVRASGRESACVHVAAGVVDDVVMGEAMVVRWRRYGKDRLYVNGPEDETYGWGDLLTGVIQVVEDGRRDLVEETLRQHPAWSQVDVAGEEARPSTAADHEPVAVPRPRSAAPTEALAVEPWVDLALNRPGQAARERAVQHRRAAPVKTLVARVLGVHTDERAWRVGADGEELVAQVLGKLGEQWRVLHSVPVGRRGADIDHVVIGPGGVFTVNAKNHSGRTVWVGGDTIMIGQSRVPYVRNARFEADRAQRLLAQATGVDFPVTGIIALICDRLTIKAAPHDVLVTQARNLGGELRRSEPLMTAEQVAHVYEHARRSTTWKPSH